MPKKKIEYIDLDRYLKIVPITIFSGPPVVEKKDLEILRVLLSKKGITCYRLGRELTGQFSTAWREVKKLIKKGLIEVIQTRERAR